MRFKEMTYRGPGPTLKDSVGKLNFRGQGAGLKPPRSKSKAHSGKNLFF
jgi:hypothetical protein